MFELTVHETCSRQMAGEIAKKASPRQNIPEESGAGMRSVAPWGLWAAGGEAGGVHFPQGTDLGKLVNLLHHCSKQGVDTLVNQTLHVMHRLLVRQVQAEFILNL